MFLEHKHYFLLRLPQNYVVFSKAIEVKYFQKDINPYVFYISSTLI